MIKQPKPTRKLIGINPPSAMSTAVRASVGFRPLPMRVTYLELKTAQVIVELL
jgi:hypothetical protein